MTATTEYSDEFINAYIDGELDNDERARLLFDEQHDAELAQRICNARILKEKVMLAYADLNTPPTGLPVNHAARSHPSRFRSLAASIAILFAIAATLGYTFYQQQQRINAAAQLIASTDTIPADALAPVVGNHQRVILNISQYQPQQFDNTVQHIESLLSMRRNDRSFTLEIVANGQGLKALDKQTSKHAGKLTQLAKRFGNLKIVACAKSLAKLASQGDPVQLVASIMLTPSAAEQVARRTGEGWLYIKI